MTTPETSLRRWRAREIRTALALSAPAGLGMFPLGIAFGLLVAQSGLEAWVAPGLSTFGYAGSVELLMIDAITSMMPLATVALTILFVNFRHVFYAFSFPLRVIKNPVLKIYSMYSLTDEAYAITAAHPHGWSATRLLALEISLQSYWVGGGLLGVMLGSFIPQPIEGLDFAMCALFITLTLDAARTRAQIPSVLLAGVAFGFAALLTPSSIIFTGMITFMVLLTARYLLAKRKGGLNFV